MPRLAQNTAHCWDTEDFSLYIYRRENVLHSLTVIFEEQISETISKHQDWFQEQRRRREWSLSCSTDNAASPRYHFWSLNSNYNTPFPSTTSKSYATEEHANKQSKIEDEDTLGVSSLISSDSWILKCPVSCARDVFVIVTEHLQQCCKCCCKTTPLFVLPHNKLTSPSAKRFYCRYGPSGLCKEGRCIYIGRPRNSAKQTTRWARTAERTTYTKSRRQTTSQIYFKSSTQWAE